MQNEVSLNLDFAIKFELMANSSATSKSSSLSEKMVSTLQALNPFQDFTRSTFNKPMITSLGLHALLLAVVVGSGYFRNSQSKLIPQIDVDLVDIEFTTEDQDLSNIRQRVLRQQKAAPVAKTVATERSVVQQQEISEKMALDPTLKRSLKDLKSPTLANSDVNPDATAEDSVADGTSDKTVNSDSTDGSSQIQKIKMSYEQYLMSYIAKYKTYPRIAERLKQQGMVYPKIRITKDGKLKDVVISKSSGFSSLDQGAINLIKSLAPFKPLPENLEEEYTITIPIEYILVGS